MYESPKDAVVYFSTIIIGSQVIAVCRSRLQLPVNVNTKCDVCPIDNHIISINSSQMTLHYDGYTFAAILLGK